MVARFRDRIWSTAWFKTARSWETRRKPDFACRYWATAWRPWASRWLVGSSMSKNRFLRRKRAASKSLVCSPKLRVSKGRARASEEICSLFASRSKRSSIPYPSMASYCSSTSPYRLSASKEPSVKSASICASHLAKGATASRATCKAGRPGSSTSKGK